MDALEIIDKHIGGVIQMQIVIDIPEEAYKQIMEFGFLENTLGKICYNAIKNGTVLPKGHGRLIDVNSIDSFIDIEYNGRYIDDIDEIPTVLEADNESFTQHAT